ncbi:MAG: hypothetical protein J6W81_00615 [Lentisphaeria bacterium]|nr:hypothetical protein [Lentisphaeria bacterium]
MRKKFLTLKDTIAVLVFSLSGLLLTGCATFSADTDMRSCPVMDANYPFKLYIRKINFNLQSLTAMLEKSQELSLHSLQETRGLIKTELEKEYPQLFHTGKHLQSNLPLSIEIDYKSKPVTSPFLSSLNMFAAVFTLGLIPVCYFDSKSYFEITIHVADAVLTPRINTEVQGYAGWFSPLCVSGKNKQIHYINYSGNERSIELLHFSSILKWAILKAIRDHKETIIRENIRHNS